MAQRRKSLTEKEIRTVLAVFESINEKCRYNWGELNKFMGSLTIEEMQELNRKLEKWYSPEAYAEKHGEVY